MAVPRNRTSNSRKNLRRSHHALKARNFRTCKNCGAVHLPHHICSSCGMYKGKVIVAQKEKTA